MTAAHAETPLLPPPRAWVYRIEGGQKVVYALAPPAAPLTLCVFTHTPPPRAHAQALFRRHLGSFLLPATTVRLPPPYLAALRRLHPGPQPRPLGAGHAHLCLDLALCFGPATVLVELKPKAGVACRSRLVPPALAAALDKFVTPPYHLKHYALPPARAPPPARRYRPPELLRGRRVARHLMLLHDQRASGLRVFRAGRLVLHDGVGRACCGGECARVLHVAATAMRESGCLKGVRRVQEADYLDDAGAAVVWKRLMAVVGEETAREMVEELMYRYDEEEEEEEGEGEGEEEDERENGDDNHSDGSDDDDDDDYDVDEVDYVDDNGDDGDHHDHHRIGGGKQALNSEREEFLRAKAAVSYRSAAEGAKMHGRDKYETAMKAVGRMGAAVAARMLADFMQAVAAKDCSVMVSVCGTGDNTVSEVHVVDVGAKGLDKIEGKWERRDAIRAAEVAARGGLQKML